MKKWYAIVSGVVALCLLLTFVYFPSKDEAEEIPEIEYSESVDDIDPTDTSEPETEEETPVKQEENKEASSDEAKAEIPEEKTEEENDTPENKLPSVSQTTNKNDSEKEEIKEETPPETEEKEEETEEKEEGTVPGTEPEKEETKNETETLPDTEAGEEEEELLEGQITSSSYPYRSSQLSDGLAIQLGTSLAFKKSYLTCDGASLIIKQGHKTPSATVALEFAEKNSSGASAVYVKVDATEQTDASLVKFLMKSEKASEIRSGGIYYLIDAEGRIFKFNHSSNRSCSIPAGFSGYVVLPLEEYVFISGQTGIDTETVSGIQIQFQSVEKDVNKKMTFSDFKFAYQVDSGVEIYDEAYVNMTSISSSAYPYYTSTVDVVDALNENTIVTTVGGYPAADGKTYEGRVRLKQTHTNDLSGVKLSLNYSSAGYDAVYIEVDNTENDAVWLKFLCNTSSGYAEMKANSTAYLIKKNNTYYTYNNTNDTRSICIPAAFKGIVAIPLDNFSYVTSGEALSEFDVSGLTVLMKSVEQNAEKSIYLDNYGYIVGELSANQIVETDYEFTGLETVLVNDLSETPEVLSSWNGITSDYYAVEDGQLRITCGHTSTSATVALGYGGDPTGKVGLSLDVDASEMEGASYVKFMINTSEGYSQLVSGGYYYLYEDGVFYKQTHASNYSAYIPKGFKGKIILPFVQYAYAGTNSRIDARTLSGSIYIQLQNVTQDTSKSLYFDNFTYVVGETGESGSMVQIPMGGGGYVTGVYIHPLDNSVKYIRTDVGGAYKWDEDNNKWIQIMGYFGSLSQMYSVDALALDPNNVNVLYVGLGNGSGTGTRGVYKSTDRGETWTIVKGVTYFGNNGQRETGEAIVVDPNNSNVVYAGTRREGLWYSRDAGSSWTQVSTSVIPQNHTTDGTTTNYGIRSVAIDTTETVDGRSKTIYVAGYGVGVYCSQDGGENWSKVDALPDYARYLRTASDGTLYVSSNEGLFKYKDGTVTNISPSGLDYFHALDVDPTNPNRIIVCRSHAGGAGPMGLAIFLSEDGGETWTDKTSSNRKIDKVAWWPSYYFSSATACLKFNPHNPEEVWMTDWYGVWTTYNINETRVDWYSKVRGHEECVITDTVSLPEGPVRFLAGTYDNGTLYYTDVTEYPVERLHGDTPDIGYSFANPNFVIYATTGSSIHVSEDYGITSTSIDSGVENTMGVAISATDTNNFLVIGWSTVPYYTKDGGATWQASTGATANEMTSKWGKKTILEPDGANGNVFYYSGKEGLYRSDDGGATFSLVNTTFTDFVTIYTARGKEGWVYAVSGGTLYISTDYGNTFTASSNMTSVNSISFGKGKTANELAFYAVGVYNGTRGLYISDDYGETWELMKNSSELMTFGGVEGDMQVYGACYLTSGGLGAVICYK